MIELIYSEQHKHETNLKGGKCPRHDNLQTSLLQLPVITSVCRPQRSSCYRTRSNIRRQATLLLKLLPTNESLPPATTPQNQMNTSSQIQHSHFLLSFSLATPLTTLPLLTITVCLACLSCVSAAYWLLLKNANVMHYVKALGFPLMPPTEEMDPAQLINLETQSTGSIQ